VSGHDIPKSIIEDTLYRIKDLFGEKSVYRGRIYKGLICSCFYYSCKKAGFNIQLNTILKIFSCDTKTFNKCCRIYAEHCNVDNTIREKDDITRAFGNLNMNSKLLVCAKKVLKAGIVLHYITSVSPQGRIGGVIFFLETKLSLGISLETICKLTDISKPTILKVSKILLKNELEIYNYIKFYM